MFAFNEILVGSNFRRKAHGRSGAELEGPGKVVADHKWRQGSARESGGHLLMIVRALLFWPETLCGESVGKKVTRHWGMQTPS